MIGEIEYIRKQVFGGFNRTDVVNYVAKLTKERNDEREASNIAKRELADLTDEMAKLKLELEETKTHINEAERHRDQIEEAKAAIGKAAILYLDLEKTNDEVKRAKREAEEAKQEAERARQEVEEAKREAAAARLEAEKIKRWANQNREVMKSVFETAEKTFTEFESSS